MMDEHNQPLARAGVGVFHTWTKFFWRLRLPPIPINAL
jgi:hypothetical protein